ncbi:MAG: universal stress protein [Nitratireductor sp.]|jgi:nucleotide-binding universal stress UspA family protein
MTFRNILVPIEDSALLPSMLQCAFLTAKRFSGSIEGMPVRRALLEVVAVGPDGFVGATAHLVEDFERDEATRAQRCKDKFVSFMGDHGVTLVEPLTAMDSVVASWNEQGAPGDAVVGNRGRLFDLIVVGRPARDTSTPRMSTLEAGLFDSGRPLLIAPPEAPKALGETVVIAWNGSTETARTIAFADAFLRAAKKVVVLSVEGAMVPGPTGAELAQYLTRKGIAAEPKDILNPDKPAGEVMLREAMALGADLLVKGGYTQSRVRQMIFGGATSHILANAEMPVFMAH